MRKFVLLTLTLATIFCGKGYTSPALANQSPPRKVTITSIVDPELLLEKGEATLRKDIINIIDFASEVFEKEFGITFILDTISPWNLPTGNPEINSIDALDELNSISHHVPSDIVLGFLKKEKRLFKCAVLLPDEITIPEPPCQQGERKDYGAGFAYYYPQSIDHVAVMLLDSDTKFLALHELAHIFGARHTPEGYLGSSIMSRYFGNITAFDQNNKKIIRANRLRTFEKPAIP